MKDKLSFTFHRTFKFNRVQISYILKLIHENDNLKITKNTLLKELKIGTIYAEAYPRYAIAAGLLHPISKTLTPLGQYVVQNDPLLNKLSTLWLLHYHISNSKGIGPQFWNFLVNKFFIPNKFVLRENFYDELFNFNLSFHNEIFTTRTIKTSASVFLNSYLNDEGFGKLNIFKKIDNTKLFTNVSSFSNDLVLGYAIIDFFQLDKNNGEIYLAEILSSELKSIFLLSENIFMELIDNLMMRNLIFMKNDMKTIGINFNINLTDYLESIYA